MRLNIRSMFISTYTTVESLLKYIYSKHRSSLSVEPNSPISIEDIQQEKQNILVLTSKKRLIVKMTVMKLSSFNKIWGWRNILSETSTKVIIVEFEEIVHMCLPKILKSVHENTSKLNWSVNEQHLYSTTWIDRSAAESQVCL